MTTALGWFSLFFLFPLNLFFVLTEGSLLSGVSAGLNLLCFLWCLSEEDTE